ncbi:hypothetical protein BIV57_10920 [Mangrovactinospora gilvigrisea]|uniref:Uncharacterized protein n=1 Tax=Mangrovactinospora gilvigrisea TaxID=1428644 RepID=A0A1J7C7E7_9ACTN|nr:hypothetical protein BIV57_10920 [Mangrovactinospora gilvigrisea]
MSSLIAAAVHDAAEDEPALVPLSRPEFVRPLRALVLPPVRDREHVLHGPLGGDGTKPSRPPAASNDTTDTTNRDQELRLPCQSTKRLSSQ